MLSVCGTALGRIQALRAGDLIATDAHGDPPTIPFWRGEAPGRTVELSEEVSRLREEINNQVTSLAATQRGARHSAEE